MASRTFSASTTSPTNSSLTNDEQEERKFSVATALERSKSAVFALHCLKQYFAENTNNSCSYKATEEYSTEGGFCYKRFALRTLTSPVLHATTSHYVPCCKNSFISGRPIVFTRLCSRHYTLRAPPQAPRSKILNLIFKDVSIKRVVSNIPLMTHIVKESYCVESKM